MTILNANFKKISCNLQNKSPDVHCIRPILQKKQKQLSPCLQISYIASASRGFAPRSSLWLRPMVPWYENMTSPVNRKYITYRNAVKNLVKFDRSCIFRAIRANRQTDRQTSHMARCVTFAVARIRVGNRRNFAYFSLWHPKYGRQGIQKGLHGSEDRYIPADQIWL